MRQYSIRSAVALPPVLLVLVMVLAVGLAAAQDAAPVVRTRQGSVRGRHQASSSGRRLQAFYNLPYASPPVGQLRFRDPQPPEEWVHIRDASRPGSNCIQNDVFLFLTGITGSEDCLYLNVFTPQTSQSSLLPVMFWVHGGGFFNGGGALYGPDFLLDHDVVLVTINYRLAAFGFLSTEDDAAPGNFGLKDQVAALRWVQDNIAAFGGDPGSVTVFGESAGAASVHYLALSPLTKGLVHRVIMQSGSAVAPWAAAGRGTAADNARKLAAVLGCPASPTVDMVDCLRNVDDYRILESDKYLKKWGMDPAITMRPVVEGEKEGSFLPKHPLHLEPHEVEWIIGVNDNEGGIRTAGMYQNKTLMEEYEENFIKILPITLFWDNVPNADVNAEAIRQFYFPSGDISLRELTDLYSDAWFIWNSDESVRRYKSKHSVFYYQLTYRGKYRSADPHRKIDFDFDAGHTDDLFYLFPSNPFYAGNYELPEEDIAFSKTVTQLWTNFAKTGNPTPDGEPIRWPKVTSDVELEYLDLGRKLNVRKGLAQKRVEFWQSLHLRDGIKDEFSKDEL